MEYKYLKIEDSIIKFLNITDPLNKVNPCKIESLGMRPKNPLNP